MQLIFKEEFDFGSNRFLEKIWNSLMLGMNPYLDYLDEYKAKFGRRWDASLTATARTGIKKHSIRSDVKDRWKVGTMIHFIIHPYNENRFQFAPLLPVTSVQTIKVRNLFSLEDGIEIDGRELSKEEIQELAFNDGFDTVKDFWNYFKGENFEGKIIHWTPNFKY